MNEILVLAEHRQGEIRETTWELLSGGRSLAENRQASLTVLLLGHGAGGMAERLRSGAHSVLVADDAELENFNSGPYQRVLSHVIRQRQPVLVLMGHTACGMDLAPSLAAELDMPLVTDCIGLDLSSGTLTATRQMYGGKVNAEVACRQGEGYLATVRSGVFSEEQRAALDGEITSIESPPGLETGLKRFIEYLESPAGEVDITQADVIVAVGRGIKEAKNLEMAQDFADAIGGVLACSRPIVDKNWLPKDRQVGTSGKTVKPRLYIAVGISGTFQHIAGITGAGTIVAINRDPKAPVFNVADYGIVDDLFKVLPVLKVKLAEARGQA